MVRSSETEAVQSIQRERESMHRAKHTFEEKFHAVAFFFLSFLSLFLSLSFFCPVVGPRNRTILPRLFSSSSERPRPASGKSRFFLSTTSRKNENALLFLRLILLLGMDPSTIQCFGAKTRKEALLLIIISSLISKFSISSRGLRCFDGEKLRCFGVRKDCNLLIN